MVSVDKEVMLKKIQRVAESRGGKCLSPIYIKMKSRMLFECERGHQWWAQADNVKNGGAWCRKCMYIDQKRTIEDIKKIAVERGLECVSDEYIDYYSKMKWKCSKGHIWETSMNSIMTNRGCHICESERKKTPRKYSIEKLREIAQARGGDCLSRKYFGYTKKHKWICKEGHTWNTTASNVTVGYWCPHCGIGNVSENKVRKIFEDIFQRPFPTIYPKWLKNPKTKRGAMQLDGYDEELKIAFEYNGRQHYQDIEFFKCIPFEHRQYLDRLKVDLCRENGVHLIIIPYIIRPNEYRQFILSELSKIEGFWEILFQVTH